MERMTHAILIFTFSPVQSFICEARRAGDLYAGSKILSWLANAAATVMQCDDCALIYPANPNPDDMPNKLVAQVPFEQAEQIAQNARDKLLEAWRGIAKTAYDELSKYQPAPDATWKTIWERQMSNFWEIYWVAQKMDGDYQAAFKAASDALDAVKRTRAFVASEEEGMKDSLSGRRSALRVADTDARGYWESVYKKLHNPSLLRPDGKERLDTLGAIKRFCNIAGAENFASVSMIATKEYVGKATGALAFPPFRTAVERLLHDKRYRVSDDKLWPYDGDLFFIETLTKERLKDSYDLDKPDANLLRQAQETLKALHEQVGKPSPYYAILQLDGDSMGEKISECESAEQHRRFSQQLAEFAKQVERIVKQHHGELIYAGGDDVLALAPLAQALPLAQELARAFQEMVKHPTREAESCTMSAGIAIAHHLYPLDAALAAARGAERRAKEEVEGKNAVCVRVLKRSGETFDARSPWTAMGDVFAEIVNLFDDKGTGASALSSRFAYDVVRSAYALPDADARLQSELKRLLKRHRNSKDPNAPDVEEWAKKLKEWAEKLPDHADELGKWLVLARFVVQGGSE
jgi:CRISPR-associated protein Cmr2